MAYEQAADAAVIRLRNLEIPVLPNEMFSALGHVAQLRKHETAESDEIARRQGLRLQQFDNFVHRCRRVDNK
jgi:hypothetical protein